MATKKDTGIVNIHGKQYKTVALRVTEFRGEECYEGFSLTTEVVAGGDPVVMKAMIGDTEGRIVATGHAEENRNSSQINKTSALENCETSAIGRALAALGLAGTEFASADEVANAIHQQKNPANARKSDGAKQTTAMEETLDEMNLELDPEQVANTVINFFDGDKASARDFLTVSGFPVPSECDKDQLYGILNALKVEGKKRDKK